MTAWLIDTNVVSELRRPRPAKPVLAFFETQSLETVHISVATLSELRYGIECVDDLRKRTELHEWIEQTARPMFHGRVLPIDEEVMLIWRLMLQKGRRSNYTFPQPHLILAATAERFRMTVVSRDKKIFERACVPVLDPWYEN